MMQSARHRQTLMLSMFVLFMLLGGCGALMESKEPPLREYWIVPDASQGVVRPVLSNRAIALTVRAAPGLDRVALLQLEPSGRLREYAGARWTDKATAVVRLYLRLALEQAQSPTQTQVTDFGRDRIAVQLELREFYVLAERDRETARLSARVEYACNDRAYTRDLNASLPVAEQRLAAVVAAHRRNLAELSGELIRALAEDCPSEA